jgi:hypothetical protein
MAVIPPGPSASRELTFVGLRQVIMQRPGESSDGVHERLRSQVERSFVSLAEPTRITTRSWLTADVSELLGIPGAVAVCTSTCKHEFLEGPLGVQPYSVFVGIRKVSGWQTKRTYDGANQYQLKPLGRVLTQVEKSAIYDRMLP